MKVLSIAKALMSSGYLQGAKASTALATDVFQVSILVVGDWARVSVPARHYFSTYMTTTDQHQDPVLGLIE